MFKNKSWHYFFITFIVLSVIAANLIFSETFHYPLPPVKTSYVAKYTVIDLSSVISGMRRLGADIAWIQLLQYYGTSEKPLDKETEYRLSLDMTKYLFGVPVTKTECHDKNCHDEGHYHPNLEGGVYPELLNYCYRVVNLDPFFFYVYLYGAGALAWNHDRTEEAFELLKKGIENMEKYKYNITKDVQQPFWQLNLYASAIIYRKKGESEKMFALLDTAAKQPGAPNLVKVIVANIYQEKKNYVSALRLWESIYDTKDAEYYSKAKYKIEELIGLLKAG